MDMGIKSILCIIMPLNLVEGLLDIYPEVVALFFNGGRVANFTDYNMYAVWMLDSANEWVVCDIGCNVILTFKFRDQ